MQFGGKFNQLSFLWQSKIIFLEKTLNKDTITASKQSINILFPPNSQLIYIFYDWVLAPITEPTPNPPESTSIQQEHVKFLNKRKMSPKPLKFLYDIIRNHTKPNHVLQPISMKQSAERLHLSNFVVKTRFDCSVCVFFWTSLSYNVTLKPPVKTGRCYFWRSLQYRQTRTRSQQAQEKSRGVAGRQAGGMACTVGRQHRCTEKGFFLHAGERRGTWEDFLHSCSGVGMTSGWTFIRK